MLNNQRSGTALRNLLASDLHEILQHSSDIQGDTKALLENFGKDLGLDVKVIFAEGEKLPKESQDSKGAAYVNGTSKETTIPKDSETYIPWTRNLNNVNELDINQFVGLKNNGIVKVNSSGSNRPLTSVPNSFYSTGKGEHIFIYDDKGKLIYDISSKRVKSFKINIDPMGREYFQDYKLNGNVPDEIKKIYGW